MPRNNETKSLKTTLLERRAEKAVIVFATTPYCQLGTACIKARSVGKMSKSIKYVWHYRRDPTSVICLGQPSEWDYELLY